MIFIRKVLLTQCKILYLRLGEFVHNLLNNNTEQITKKTFYIDNIARDSSQYINKQTNI